MIYTKIFDMIFFLDNFDVNLFNSLCVNRFVSSEHYYMSMSDPFYIERWVNFSFFIYPSDLIVNIDSADESIRRHEKIYNS